MKTSVGARVGAILSMTEDTVQLLGYGVYDGEHEPPFGPFGVSKSEHDAMVSEMKAKGELPVDYVWKNPRITLDDGTIVWGAQCWWGPEDVIRQRIVGRTVISSTIEEQ